MGGLSHYLEQEGLATTQISLIRLHTEKIVPPRALWVPFPLGRPLGVPGDARFQKRVLRAALALLEAPRGPVLEDYPQEAPQSEDQGPWACPLSLPPPEEGGDDRQALARRFRAEMARLASWYQLSRERRGRTIYGASGLEPRELAEFMAGCLRELPRHSPRPHLDPAGLIKQASEDLKAYYLEAVTARPGPAPPPGQGLEDWFWGATAAGQVLLQIQKSCREHQDQQMQLLGKLLLVPRSQMHRCL